MSLTQYEMERHIENMRRQQEIYGGLSGLGSALGGLIDQRAAVQSVKKPVPQTQSYQDPQPNPVLLLTGDDE